MTVNTFTYKKDENFVDITGTIQNVPDYCKYVQTGGSVKPLISFDLVSFRKRKNVEEEWQTDQNRIILFDNENFHKDFSNGDRVRIKGELQSRNFTRDNHEVDEMLKSSVKNYIDIWGKFPAKKEPKGKIREPISWELLLKVGLIPRIPEDSMYLEDGSKSKSKDSPFVYRVDENGEVYKETEHVAYEILATSVERLFEEVDPLFGDKNKVVLVGKVTKQPYFDFLGNATKVPFCSFNVRTKSNYFEDRAFYNNVISWSVLAEEAFQNIQPNETVKIVGRLQSRGYQKELIKRWKTPSGKRKKKVINLDLTTREISASKVFIEEKK